MQTYDTKLLACKTAEPVWGGGMHHVSITTNGHNFLWLSYFMKKRQTDKGETVPTVYSLTGFSNKISNKKIVWLYVFQLHLWITSRAETHGQVVIWQHLKQRIKRDLDGWLNYDNVIHILWRRSIIHYGYADNFKEQDKQWAVH